MSTDARQRRREREAPESPEALHLYWVEQCRIGLHPWCRDPSADRNVHTGGRYVSIESTRRCPTCDASEKQCGPWQALLKTRYGYVRTFLNRGPLC